LPLANKEKPPILRRPRRLLMLDGALLALLFVVYLAPAATGFLRTQTKTPDARMTGAEPRWNAPCDGMSRLERLEHRRVPPLKLPS